MLNPEMTRLLAEARIAELHRQAGSRRHCPRLSWYAARVRAERRRQVRTSMGRNLRATIIGASARVPSKGTT